MDNDVDEDAIFRRALDAELDKICSFYQPKESEILSEVDEVIKDQHSYASDTNGVDMNPVSETVVKARRMGSGDKRGRRPSAGSESGEADSDAEDDRLQFTNGHQRRRSRDGDSVAEDGDSGVMADSAILGSTSQFGSGRSVQRDYFRDPEFLNLYNAGVSLKGRTVEAYVSLCELKSYVQLNKTGFSKAIKKYDKILNRSLRREYMDTTVSEAYPFTDSVMKRLEQNIRGIEKAYAGIVTKGDLQLARRELRLNLREHVVWERNTVWREMIGIERKAQAANVGIRNTLLGGDQDPVAAHRQGDELEDQAKEIATPLGRYNLPRWLYSLSFVSLVGILVVFAVLLSIPILEKPEQQNCLAMLVFVSLLWATEVIPLFVTSLLIPFLVVVLRIMRSETKPHHRLEAKEATGAVFAAMWTPVIMLLLGGFAIAAALSKYDIARRMATFVLSKAGNKPKVVLLTNMFVSMFLSMWISNVASPVLCYSIIQVSTV